MEEGKAAERIKGTRLLKVRMSRSLYAAVAHAFSKSQTKSVCTETERCVLQRAKSSYPQTRNATVTIIRLQLTVPDEY